MSEDARRRRVVVTGGGTGMGRAIAASFVRDGDDVVLVGRRAAVVRQAAAELDDRGPGRARAVPADCSSAADVEQLAEALGDAELDVLVLAAGGLDRTVDRGTLAGLADAWRADLDMNVLTAVLAVEALRDRLRRPGARIVLFSSIAALRGGGGSYSAAKAALHGYAFDLAADLGPDGITVNVIAPGFVDGTEFFGSTMSDERRARLVAGTLVGRGGEPDDVVAAVRYLSSPEAGYVTGQIVQVNGGAYLGR
jgi:3-oxoacyl-[acyl-carrier protein] reductase